ncbi:MAG: AAA family ATPase, partial [Myxococcota bacterium]|nr:AAA family ATPase [Myxococcota bacterium]
YLLGNTRLCVEGGAGTGKTVMAMEGARLHAEAGRRVLLLCFNKALGYHLESVMKSVRELSGRVDTMHFHRLCAWASYALERGDLAVPSEKSAARDFWQNDAPMVLLEAVEAGVIGPWDAVIIDEGQDFAANWWPVVDSLLASPESYLVVCQDPAQAIFTDGSAAYSGPAFKCNLTTNLRNIKAIARVVQQLSDTETEPDWRLPEGFAPTVISQ